MINENGLSAYQQLEALVFTDNSDNFPQWPNKPAALRNETNFRMLNYKQRKPDNERVSTPINENSNTIPVKSLRNSIDKEQKLMTLRRTNANLRNSIERDEFDNKDIDYQKRFPISVMAALESKTSPSVSSKSNIFDPRLNDILVQAQNLLDDVKYAGTKFLNRSTDKIKRENIKQNLIKDIVLPDTPKSSRMLTDIDFLLNGVPDLYDEENPTIDDQLIEKILGEGGTPPSQLRFPSIYAANQRLMSRLQNCKYLNVSVTHFMINSVRYGVRKDSSFLHIRPPTIGVEINSNQSASGLVTFPLNDLKEKYIPRTGTLSASTTRKSEKKVSLSDFFSGSVPLQNVQHEFKLNLSDEVAHDWLTIQSSDRSCIRLEIYSLLYSPEALRAISNKAKAKSLAVPVRFASADIPLSGLLGTESLDAIVTCELTADADTQIVVANRLSSLPTDSNKLSRGALSTKMGSVTLRISLEKESRHDLLPSDESKDENLKSFNKSASVMVVPIPTIQDDRRQITSFSTPEDEALSYIPIEPRAENATPIGISFVGISIYRLILNGNNLFSILNHHHVDLRESHHAITIRYVDLKKEPHEYKLSISPQTSESKETKLISFRCDYVIDHSTVIDIDLSHDSNQLGLVVFEVWYESGSEQSNLSKAKQRVLLGIAKLKCLLTERSIESALEVQDIRSGLTCCELFVSFHHSTNRERVESEICRFRYRDDLFPYELSVETILVEHEDMSSRRNEDDQRVVENNDESRENGLIDQLEDDRHKSWTGLDSTVELGQLSNDVIARPADDEDMPEPRPYAVPAPVQRSPDSWVFNTYDSPTITAENNAIQTIDVVTNISRYGDSEVVDEVDDKHVEDYIAPSSTIPETESFPSRIHAIDISLDSPSSRMSSPTSETPQSTNILGCDVFYSLRANCILSSSCQEVRFPIDSQQSFKMNTKTYSLWWDNECAVLNSRNSHRIILKDTEPLFDSLTNESIDIIKDLTDAEVGLTFTIIPKMDDIHTKDFIGMNHLIGHAELDSMQLASVLNQAGCYRTFSLPIDWKTSFDSDSMHIIALSLLKTLPLTISHRIEPRLVNSSKDVVHAVSHEPVTTEISLLVNDVSQKDSLTPSSSNSNPSIRFEAIIEELSNISLEADDMTDSMLFVACESIGKNGKLSSSPLDRLDGRFTDRICLTEGKLLSSMKKSPHNGLLSLQWNYSFDFNMSLISMHSEEMNPSLKSLFREHFLLLTLYRRQIWKLQNQAKANDSSLIIEKVSVGDIVVGSVIVDLSLFGYGLSKIEGWYHIIDSLQDSSGQMKISINLQSPSIASSEVNKSSMAIEQVDESQENQCNVDYQALRGDIHDALNQELKTQDSSQPIDENEIDGGHIGDFDDSYNELQSILHVLNETQRRLLQMQDYDSIEEFSSSMSLTAEPKDAADLPSIESDMEFDSIGEKFQVSESLSPLDGIKTALSVSDPRSSEFKMDSGLEDSIDRDIDHMGIADSPTLQRPSSIDGSSIIINDESTSSILSAFSLNRPVTNIGIDSNMIDIDIPQRFETDNSPIDNIIAEHFDSDHDFNSMESFLSGDQIVESDDWNSFVVDDLLSDETQHRVIDVNQSNILKDEGLTMQSSGIHLNEGIVQSEIHLIDAGESKDECSNDSSSTSDPITIFDGQDRFIDLDSHHWMSEDRRISIDLIDDHEIKESGHDESLLINNASVLDDDVSEHSSLINRTELSTHESDDQYSEDFEDDSSHSNNHRFLSSASFPIQLSMVTDERESVNNDVTSSPESIDRSHENIYGNKYNELREMTRNTEEKQTQKDDSPTTIRIRQLVEDAVNQRLQTQSSSTRDNQTVRNRDIERLDNNEAHSTQFNDLFIRSIDVQRKLGAAVSPVDLVQGHTARAMPPPTAKTSRPLNLQNVEVKMQQLRKEALDRLTNQSSTTNLSKLSSQQRKYLDAENDRISKIMFRSFSHKDE